jgi:hypothetical protein
MAYFTEKGAPDTNCIYGRSMVRWNLRNTTDSDPPRRVDPSPDVIGHG